MTAAEEHLRQRGDEFLGAVLELLEDGVVACDAHGAVVFSNHAWRAFHGLAEQPRRADEREGYELYRADGTTPLPREEAPLARALAGDEVHHMEVVVVPEGGPRRALLANGQHVTGADGRTLGAVVAVHDLTRQRQAEAGLAFHALHDVITGLPHRTLFVDRVEQALERARRHHWCTAVLYVDLDRFRVVNENLDRTTGNRVLVSLARRLEAGLRPDDTVARVEGDEFALLCENVADTEGAVTLATRVLEAVAEPVRAGTKEVSLTASVGVAVTEDGLVDAQGLLADAEVAMRRAKAQGSARYALFSEEMRLDHLARAESERALQHALEAGELRVVYQPKVSLDTDRIMGVEALLRWEHPERGTVPPMQFISIAEETGLIVPIGAWVLEEACRQSSQWREAFPERLPLLVSVNASARQFDQGLVDAVSRALESSTVDPGTLCLEVTESIVMEDVDSAIEILRALKSLGIKISIDDFGTGYSSMAYLKRFPLDMLKVDRSFVDGLGHEPEDTAIVAAVVGMAHALELSVVAEGVETEEQLARLRTLGCEYAQGYYFARPQRADAIDTLLKSEHMAAQRAQATAGNGRGARSPWVIERVLVADDSPDVLQLARMSLAAAGFEVHETANGGEALSAARELRPDCVVLDLMMPDITGFDVARALRADPATSDTTILMLTANALAADKVEAFSLGVDDYIVKPFAPRDLVSRVRAAMRRRREAAPG